MIEHILDEYNSSWHLSVVDVDGVVPSELWRTSVYPPYHRISRFGGYGGTEEMLFEFEVPTNGGLFFGDVDGDGRIDAIDHGSKLPQWYRGDTRLGFATDSEPLVTPPGYGLQMATDFSGDGLLDLVIGNNYYTDLTSAIGDGTGVFTAAHEHNFDPRGNYQPAEFYAFGGWEWFLVKHNLCDSCEDGLALGSLGSDGTIEEPQRIDGLRFREFYGYGFHNDDDIPDVMVSVIPPKHEQGDGIDIVWLDSTPGGEFEVSLVLSGVTNSTAIDIDGDGQAELVRRTPSYTYEIQHYDGSTFGVPEPILGLPRLAVIFEIDYGHGDLDGDGWVDFLGYEVDTGPGGGGGGPVIGDRIWSIQPCEKS